MNDDMKHPDIVDYAMPLMRIERYAKLAHDACLSKDLGEAVYFAEQLAVEARILRQTLRIMKENERHADPQEVPA